MSDEVDDAEQETEALYDFIEWAYDNEIEQRIIDRLAQQAQGVLDRYLPSQAVQADAAVPSPSERGDAPPSGGAAPTEAA